MIWAIDFCIRSHHSLFDILFLFFIRHMPCTRKLSLSCKRLTVEPPQQLRNIAPISFFLWLQRVSDVHLSSACRTARHAVDTCTDHENWCVICVIRAWAVRCTHVFKCVWTIQTDENTIISLYYRKTSRRHRQLSIYRAWQICIISISCIPLMLSLSSRIPYVHVALWMCVSHRVCCCIPWNFTAFCRITKFH